MPRLGWRTATKELAREAWRVRGGVAALLVSTCVWLALAWLAAKAGARVGLGSEWGACRSALCWAGAASECYLAIALALGSALDPSEDWEPEDAASVFRAMAAVLALDAARFAAPWLAESLPGGMVWALGTPAAIWWGLVDACAVALLALFWLDAAVGGARELASAALRPDAARLREIERGELRRACAGAERRSSGPKRL